MTTFNWIITNTSQKTIYMKIKLHQKKYYKNQKFFRKSKEY